MNQIAAVFTAGVVAISASANAQTVSNAQFVNGITVSGSTLDKSSGSDFDRRVGMFSGLYYDPNRSEWWGLSDRGPGGGTLDYDTRVQRFTLDVDRATGRISNFQIAATIKFSSQGAALTGLAPSPKSILGNSFDPEGIAINPVNGNILVSDEYGPSLIEFNRNGEVVRRFTPPANVIPRSATNTPNFTDNTGNTAGRVVNRGFEGLAISPDGRYAYATLQSAMYDEGSGNGFFTRIVKYDMATGEAVGQYAYKFERTGQGRGVSELIALGNDKFLMLERNNRGLGVGATFATADKNIFQIDLAGATDISNITITGGLVLPTGVVAVGKSAKIIDLDANTLAELGNKSPEKWEGIAIGPRLDNGKYLILTGSDNDYSVTQNDQGTQFDVWMNFLDADPYAMSIQCPLGQIIGCKSTSNGTDVALDLNRYALLPGVLHAYSADIDGYVAVVPEPSTVTLMLIGLGGLAAAARRRRSNS